MRWSPQLRCRVGALLSTLLLQFWIRGDSDRGDSGRIVSPTHQLALAQSVPVSAPGPLSLAPPVVGESTNTRRDLCPQGMILVEGHYCPTVQHHCLDWLDDPKLPYARCGRYEPKPECLVAHVPLRFCIDREEYTPPGATVPVNFQSFNRAAKLCQSLHKRLCEEREWNFACEGEQMLPYPYGWTREPKCNQDREDLFEMREYWQAGERKSKQLLRDLRARSSDFPKCVSPFGVLNLVGNLDEPVRREGTSFAPMQMALKGGWWMPGRNRCRPATTAHDNDYQDVHVGARCCVNVADGR